MSSLSTRPLVALAAAAVAWIAAAGLAGRSEVALSEHPECIVARVVDGDTFDCADGTRVRLLQIDAQEVSECGGGWAAAALEFIFLRTGTPVRLEYDAAKVDRYGRHLAAPIVTGADGAKYNISIVMVYTGLAKAAYYGDNDRYLDWARAAETWARVAQWNMWAPGGPYDGGDRCEAPVTARGCDPLYWDPCER